MAHRHYLIGCTWRTHNQRGHRQQTRLRNKKSGGGHRHKITLAHSLPHTLVATKRPTLYPPRLQPSHTLVAETAHEQQIVGSPCSGPIHSPVAGAIHKVTHRPITTAPCHCPVAASTVTRLHPQHTQPQASVTLQVVIVTIRNT